MGMGNMAMSGGKDGGKWGGKDPELLARMGKGKDPELLARYAESLLNDQFQY